MHAECAISSAPASRVFVAPLIGLGLVLISAFIPSMWVGFGAMICCFILGLYGMVINWPAYKGSFALSILALVVGLIGIILCVLISFAWQNGLLTT